MRLTQKQAMQQVYQALLEDPQSAVVLAKRFKWKLRRTQHYLQLLEREGRVTRHKLPRAFTYWKAVSVSTLLDGEQIYVAFAALLTMTRDIHSVQDNLTEEQWALAEKLTASLEKLVNLHCGE